MGIENEMWNLQANANNTANTLAWMFSTKADNLVNELAKSYYAEANLANMTNALQNSLINALERGYNVSSIVNSLASVESAARSAKEALDAMNNAASGGGSGYSGGGGNTSSSGSDSDSGSSSGTLVSTVSPFFRDISIAFWLGDIISSLPFSLTHATSSSSRLCTPLAYPPTLFTLRFLLAPSWSENRARSVASSSWLG